ncbi:Poxvirus J1 protein homolog [Swinepox virus]|uniref:Poxvirus J1 protein homolog n=1 Tax=Swinepox virus TaxID=10276 RepID=A0A881SY25_SWPV|nr:Poxvirus J1 protein homolog [Swinepox virus]
MDHRKYLLTMFFEDNDSFFKYISSQEDDDALSDIAVIIRQLDFILMMLIKSKDKLESIGYLYEPLSEEYRHVIDFSDMKNLRSMFNKITIRVSDKCVQVNKGYLSDFVTSLIRLSDSDINTYDSFDITYIDPRRNITWNNILSILNEK